MILVNDSIQAMVAAHQVANRREAFAFGAGFVAASTIVATLLSAVMRFGC
jgi:hypothetical protein